MKEIFRRYTNLTYLVVPIPTLLSHNFVKKGKSNFRHYSIKNNPWCLNNNTEKIRHPPLLSLVIECSSSRKNECIFDLYTIGIKDVRWLERKWVLVLVMDCGYLKVEQSWAKLSKVEQSRAKSSNVKQSQFQLFPLLPKNPISTHFITKCWSVFFVCKSLDTTERMPLSLLNAYTTNYCSAVQDLS